MKDSIYIGFNAERADGEAIDALTRKLGLKKSEVLRRLVRTGLPALEKIELPGTAQEQRRAE